MKKIANLGSLVIACIFTAGLLVPKSVSATEAWSTAATVQRIRTTRYSTGWNGESPHFTLNGVSSVGNCPTSGGLVIFKFLDADKNILSTLTAALLSGRQVIVHLDDATNTRVDGYCRVLDLFIQ